LKAVVAAAQAPCRAGVEVIITSDAPRDGAQRRWAVEETLVLTISAVAPVHLLFLRKRRGAYRIPGRLPCAARWSGVGMVGVLMRWPKVFSHRSTFSR